MQLPHALFGTYIYIYIYNLYSASGLSCSIRDLELWSSLCNVGSSFLTRDWTQTPQHWKIRVLATGPPGKSWDTLKPGNLFRATWLDYAGVQVYGTQSPCSLLSSALPSKVSPVQGQWAVISILRHRLQMTRVRLPSLWSHTGWQWDTGRQLLWEGS